MRTTDLSWFGLRVPPFSKEIDDEDLWLPTSKVELVEDLADAIEGRATVLLTGEPGVGKTALRVNRWWGFGPETAWFRGVS